MATNEESNYTLTNRSMEIAIQPHSLIEESRGDYNTLTLTSNYYFSGLSLVVSDLVRFKIMQKLEG